MGLDQSIYSYPKEYKQLKDKGFALITSIRDLIQEWMCTDEAKEHLAMIAIMNKDAFDNVSPLTGSTLAEVILHNNVEELREEYAVIVRNILNIQTSKTIDKVSKLLLDLTKVTHTIKSIENNSKHEEVYFRKYHTLNGFMCDHLGADNCEPIIIYKEDVEDAITYCISNPESSNDTNYIGDLKELVADWDDNKIYTYEPWW